MATEIISPIQPASSAAQTGPSVSVSGPTGSPNTVTPDDDKIAAKPDMTILGVQNPQSALVEPKIEKKDAKKADDDSFWATKTTEIKDAAEKLIRKSGYSGVNSGTDFFDSVKEEQLSKQKKGLRVEFGFKFIDENDPRISEDPDRRALIRSLEKTPQKVVFSELKGAILYNLGGSISAPVGAATVGGDLSNIGKITYSVINPHAIERKLVIPKVPSQVIKSTTLPLPTTWSSDTKLVPGRQVTFEFSGSISASVNGGIGKQFQSLGPIQASAGAFLSISTGGDKKFIVSVQDLADGRRQVSLTVDSGTTNSIGVEKNFLLSAKGTSLAGSTIGGIAGKVTPKSELDTSKGIGKIAAYIGGFVFTDNEVRFGARTSITSTTRKSNINTTTFIFDGKNPKALAAYNELFRDLTRLNFKDAELLAQQSMNGEQGGVSAAKIEQKGKTTDNTLNANLLGWKILSMGLSWGKQKGTITLDSTPGVQDKSRTFYDFVRDFVGSKYGGIFSGWAGLGEAAVAREYVTFTRTTEKPNPTDPTQIIQEKGAPQSYYHLRYDLRNESTDKEELIQFLGLVKILGGKLEGPWSVDDLLAHSERLDKFGRGNFLLDISVPHEAIKLAAKASKAQKYYAAGSAYENLEGPLTRKNGWKNVPWLDFGHPRHERVMQILDNYRHGRVYFNAESNENEWEEYEQLTGGKLTDDGKALKRAEEFDLLLQDLSSDSEERRRERFNELNVDNLTKKRWLRLFAAFAKLVGPDAILVHDLRMEPKDEKTKKRISLVMKSEGKYIDHNHQVSALADLRQTK